MNSNPKPEHETCPHDGHLLDKTGKCWYCGGIYPVSRPALTVVNTEAQVEGEALETMTVDTETGELPEPTPEWHPQDGTAVCNWWEVKAL